MPTGWNYDGLPLSSWCFTHIDTYGLPTPIPDGTQAVSMCGWADNRFWQNTGVKYEAGKTYTLSFSLGKSAQEDALHTQAHLMYSTDPVDWGGGYDAARVDYYDADITLGQWNNKSISVTMTPGHDAIGKYIVLWFNAKPDQHAYTYFDNVKVTTPALPTINYSDDVTVDGNLNDWADADWKPFDKVYDGDPSDIQTGSAWAAKWGAGGTRVYMAVKVDDTAHYFTDSYTDWDARDAVELFLNTTGTDTGPYGANDYSEFQEQAQEWAVGITADNHNAVWATCGYPPLYGPYTPLANELQSAGRESAGWLYYEAALTPFEYFGGRRGNPSIVSPLHEDDTIRNDVTAVGRNATAYTGTKSSGHNEGGWHANYTVLAQHKLIRTGVKGTITLQDFVSSTLGAGAAVVITDASLVSETHNLVVDATGTYSFKTALRGSCTAVASAAGYVPQSLPVVVDTSGNGAVSFTLARLPAEAVSVAGAKQKALGVLVSLSGSITAVFSGNIYVEESSRASGIRVDKASHGFVAGDVGKIVNVTGVVSKDSSTGEIYIAANLIEPTAGTNLLLPLGLTNKTAGGGDFIDSGNGQIGVAGGFGLNNIGLLVSSTGRASAGDANGFTLTDGSGVTIQVSLPGAGSTYNGKYVTVTGISSIGSGAVRVIKARSIGDVQQVN